jgi:hypothetical protein
MIGPLLIGIGLLGFWALVSGKAGPVLDAIVGSGFNTSLDNAVGNLNLSSASSSTGSGGSSNSSGGSSGIDSGSHMGIDDSGNVITIDKAYGDMSDAEKDAANRFAHMMGG